ncbi:hypothetical protein IE81DRAFT_368471 [Ceraceosorus guamensis]|uniref:WW domain-containing protein n=1 Tax=Ceraceosorus guamensis TaxID=1522189 RepID=A0A316VRT8_9BASI|nr:hypothetical protein IE81DRAFT_368471 [Ceraceosorus guamensis]PWN40222.1 hypothetical protein IE81DRAFT_368471 [Ceraceosorus guamensis]
MVDSTAGDSSHADAAHQAARSGEEASEVLDKSSSFPAQGQNSQDVAAQDQSSVNEETEAIGAAAERPEGSMLAPQSGAEVGLVETEENGPHDAEHEEINESSSGLTQIEKSQPPLPDEPVPSHAHSWQAVWAPQSGAYYFWNTASGETTWTNPLGESGSGGAQRATRSSAAVQAGAPSAPMSDEDLAISAGIDPDLAFLDSQLYASQLASARTAHSQGQGHGSTIATASNSVGAYFDARTGRMVSASSPSQANPDASTRHSSSAKAKRQMNAYFDVDSYEAQRAAERAEAAGAASASASGGRAAQKLSKKELQYFKDRKAQKRRQQYLSGT